MGNNISLADIHLFFFCSEYTTPPMLTATPKVPYNDCHNHITPENKSCSVDLRLPTWFAGSELFPISSGGFVPALLPSFEVSRSDDPGSSLVRPE